MCLGFFITGALLTISLGWSRNNDNFSLEWSSLNRSTSTETPYLEKESLHNLMKTVKAEIDRKQRALLSRCVHDGL